MNHATRKLLATAALESGDPLVPEPQADTNQQPAPTGTPAATYPMSTVAQREAAIRKAHRRSSMTPRQAGRRSAALVLHSSHTSRSH